MLIFASDFLSHAIAFVAQKASAAARLAPGWKNIRIAAAVLAIFALFAPNALELADANGDTRTLYLYHSHSRELIAATFRVNGHYDSEVLEKLNWFLRDWRNDEPTKMDPRLFDALWEAYRSAGRNRGADDPIVVVSAYRCPATNAMLRRRSHTVAEHSQHMLGRAMDTTMPGQSMEKLREIAMRMQRGGVGYYPNANTPFVHIDVGGVRHWPRMSYDQLARLFPDGKTVHIPSNGKTLPGYAEAKAEIEARGGETVSVADAGRGGGIGGFFASLFGGGEDAEEEGRETVPAIRPVRVAAAQAGDVSDVDLAKAQRRMVARAETDLPRGETYLAPSDASASGRQAAAPAPEPAPVARAAPKPTPLDEPRGADQSPPAAEAQPAAVTDKSPDASLADKSLAEAPLPPRRPEQLAGLEAPLPPPRPAELAQLPDVITHGAAAAPRAGVGLSPLAYAAPVELAPAQNVSAEIAPAKAASFQAPLPPPRPSFKPLRAAALGKAAQTRAARAAAAQMEPARVDRAALEAMVAPAREFRARPTAAGGFAPPLRAAARLDLFAANVPPRGLKTRFGGEATALSASSFTK